MKKQILLCAVGILFIALFFCGCFAVFQPTKTPVYGSSNMFNKVDTSSSKTSSNTPYPITSTSPQSSSESSSESVSDSVPESTSTETVSSPAPQASASASQISADRNQRFLELEKRFSYDSNGRICLSEAEAEFADKSLFVGDSICRGFTAYNVVKAKNVFAAGSVGARNFFDMEFQYYGQPAAYSDVLEQTEPERVFLSMGMNDVNMTSAKEYCENYRKLIDFTLGHSGANVYVCAITPISKLEFAENSRIDSFNLAMKNYIAENYGQRVSFIDFAYLMKNSDNILSKGLDSGDGIHLAPECYYIAMLEICDQLGIK